MINVKEIAVLIKETEEETNQTIQEEVKEALEIIGSEMKRRIVVFSDLTSLGKDKQDLWFRKEEEKIFYSFGGQVFSSIEKITEKNPQKLKDALKVVEAFEEIKCKKMKPIYFLIEMNFLLRSSKDKGLYIIKNRYSNIHKTRQRSGF